MKKSVSLVIVVVLLISSSLLQAQEKSTVEAKGKSHQQLLNPTQPLQKETKNARLEWQFPDWLKRINYGVYIETDQKTPHLFRDSPAFISN